MPKHHKSTHAPTHSPEPSKQRSAQHSAQHRTQYVSWLQGWKPFVVLVLLVCGVYAQTVGFSTVKYDDSTMVMNRHLASWADVVQCFTVSLSNETYRPVMFASVAANAALFGQSPDGVSNVGAFHVVNILLHAVATVLVFFMLLLYAREQERLAAFMLAALFAVHPSAVQAVAWIPGRNDTLVAVLLLGAWIAFTITFTRWWQAVRSGGNASPQPANTLLLVHTACFAAAVFTKETALLLPVLCVVYAILTTLAFGKHSVRHVLFSKEFLTLVGVWLMIAACYLALRQSVPAWNQAGEPSVYLYGAEALAKNWRTVPELVGKMLLPVNLSPYAHFTTLSTVLGLAVCALLAAVSVLTYNATQRLEQSERAQHRVMMGIAWLWMLVLLLPPMARYRVFATLEQEYLEHRAYTSLVGLVLLLFVVLRVLVLPRLAGNAATQQRLVAVVLAVSCVVFGALTLLYQPVFRNAETFWGAAAEGNPASATARAVLASSIIEQPQRSPEMLHRAEMLAKRAAELAPNELFYGTTLAAVYIKQNRLNEADTLLRRLTAFDSASADVSYNLGYVADSRAAQAAVDSPEQRAFAAEAAQWYERALQRNAHHEKSYLNLVVLAIATKQPDQAQAVIARAKAHGVDVLQLRPALAQYLSQQPSQPTP
jgi:Tfp pilus assembly protein PilF